MNYFILNSAIAQPILNERYGIEDETNVIFSSVISTDSCYYVGAMQTSEIGLENISSSFIRFNFDGTIDSLRRIENDTMGIGFWQSNEIIQTLDGNFACFTVVDGNESHVAYMYVKINAFGDTILTKYYNDFYTDNLLIGKEPSTLIQNSDSSYFGITNVQRDDDGRAPTVFFKLDKLGNLLFYKTFYGIGIEYYHSIFYFSCIRYQ